MASAFEPASIWSLQCRKCKCNIVPLTNLQLTLLGSAGIHLNLRNNVDLEDVIEKVQNPDPKKRERAPFKALCLGRDRSFTSGNCGNSLGSYMNNTLSFSANQVCFSNGWQIQQWKKWSEAKERLQAMGIFVHSRSTMSGDVASILRCQPRRESSQMVYCNVTLTSRNTFIKLTKDKARSYQMMLFQKAMEGNSLVYLPTGCGKTLIAAMAIECMSYLNPNKVAVFLAPKTPLVQQQFQYLKGQLPELKVDVLTGEREIEETENPAWIKVLQSLANQTLHALVMSPDIFLNLLVDERDLLRMTDVSLIVFDEAHNCLGKHPYAKIMDKYKAIGERFKPLILALSASPATAVKPEQITVQLNKLLTNLDCRVVVPRPEDLRDYWNRPRIMYLLKEHNDYQKYLENELEKYLKSLNPYLLRLLDVTELDKHEIQSCNYKGILRKAMMEAQNKKDKIMGLALAEHAVSILSVLELNTVLGCAQACESLRNMLVSVEQAGNPMDRERRKILTNISSYHILVRAIGRLRISPDNVRIPSDRFRELLKELRQFAEKVRKGDNSCRGIVFVKMRKTCTKLCEAIREEDPLVCQYLNPKRFVGHGKGTHGMEWKEEQEPVLKEFHSGECKILVSTSVLEEGLDVPACNLVIRFDSVMNMRALIQSRGRAARRPDSRFVIMCNDWNEKQCFEEMEIKERNLDEVIKDKARFSFPSTRNCEIRKLDTKRCRTPRKKCSPQQRKDRGRRRKRKTVPSVSVVVYLKRSGRSDDASTGSRERGPMVDSFSNLRVSASTGRSLASNENVARHSSDQNYLEVLQDHFEVVSINRERSQLQTTSNDTATADDENIHIRLRSLPSDHTHRNEDHLFDDVVRTWCEAGPSMWLERNRRPNKRNMVFHIVPIQEIAGGDFKDRSTFSEIWNHDCRNGAEIVLLHDLKLVTIAFYNSAGVLHKIEFPYDQLREFVVLSFPQDQQESADIFFCLRHVPSLSAAKSFVSEGSDEILDCTFSEYYLRGYSDDENEAVDGVEQENGNAPQPEESSGESSDEENDQDVLWQQDGLQQLADYENNQPLRQSSPIHGEPLEEWNVSDDEDSSSESESDDENSASAVAEQINAIDDLVRVHSWSRRIQIEDGKAFGKFLTLRVRLTYTTDLYDALEALKGFGKRSYYSRIMIENQNDETRRIDRFASEVWYAHECLIGLHPNLRCRMTRSFYDKLWQMDHRTDENNCMNALYQLSATATHDYFTDPEHELNTLLARGQNVTRACISRTSVPAHCALVRRLVLTPTRVIPFPAEVMELNRVLRNYDPDCFVSVSIREEDYSKLRGNKASLEVVLEVIKGYMLRGLPLAGRNYEYVGGSNSQMRSHGCWFVQPTWRGDAEDIRSWMGDLSRIKCVASYMARLGQCFSTSLDTIGITLEEGVRYREIPDVERNNFCFSDGIGTISLDVAREVCLKVGKPTFTSALQIRFAGCKGVLCVDTNLRAGQVCIRPSMKKFESPHRRLELLQTSRPQAVYLNQQTIMLLSNLGVPDEIFMHFQQRMLDSLAEMMLNEHEALQRMSNIIRTGIDYKSLCDNGVALTTEPYFKSLMCALYKERIHRLLKKSRILLPVTGARLMMGVMDETGLLQAGQVFVQCSHMASEGNENEPEVVGNRRFIVEHTVVVTRNPCLHPGDVRQLEAVDVPALRHLVDCIVFPKNGPRSHPNEMAGGDLDGDLYFVTWNDDFRPRRDIHEPMDYPALEKKEKDGEITVEDMVEFYAEYIQCDSLGIIDTAHKAFADSEKDGVESVKCLELAEKHSLAVDAPKTGKWPSTVGLSASIYPDFMMVPNKPSYVSHKVLGRLFREVRDFEEIMNHEVPKTVVQLDSRLMFPGYRQYLRSAEMTYREYASQLQTLLTLYGIEMEGEILSGCFHKLKGDFGRERTQIAVVVRKLIHQLRTDFRVSFFREFHINGDRLLPRQVTDEMKQKASAWYHYAYKPVVDASSGSRRNHEVRFLSFPWVVDDVLLTILSSPVTTNISDAPVPNSVARDISRNIHEIFSRDAHRLLHEYDARLELLNVVARFVSTHCPHDRLVMFGSSANFLFRPDSDLDLCVISSLTGRNRTQASQIETLEKLESILRRAFGRVRLIKDAKVPVIQLGRLRSPRESRNRLKLSCDISADRNGFLKTAVLISYYKKYPWLLPLIRFIIQWARVTGLTQRLEGVLINTNVLVFMVLSFCIQKNHILASPVEDILAPYRDIRICQNENSRLFRLIIDKSNNDPIGHSRSLDTNYPANISARLGVSDRAGTSRVLGASSCVGEILLEFFKSRQQILSETFSETFRDLLGATTFSELLTSEDVETLSEQMQKAYHVLAIHGSADVLLDISSAQIQRTFTLSTLQSLEIVSERAERTRAREFSRYLLKKPRYGALKCWYEGLLFTDFCGLRKTSWNPVEILEISRMKPLASFRKSGAFVTVRPQLPGSGRNLILEARGTIGSIRVLERMLSSRENESMKKRVSTMSKCFVRGASMITFEGCHSNMDNVKLVPYHGNHHQTHDQRIRHVPLLENGIHETDNFQESEAYRSFRAKFLDQIKVVLRDYEKAIHGELEFVVHFGRIYAFDIPQASYEDSEPITIKDFQYSAAKGQDTRRQLAIRRPVKFKRPGGGGRSKPKAHPKYKVKDTKRDVDKSPNHSLFTVVSQRGMTEVEAYLIRKGYIEQPALSKKSYTVTMRKGTTDLYACYDDRLNPTVLKLPRLRWFLADIKRAWIERQENSPERSNLDGLECDVRFILGTSREFPAAEFEAGDEENVLNVLSPNPTSTPHPFIINNELQKKLQLIRYKKTSVYCKPGHRTQICLSKVKEYSRFRATTGNFRKVFERDELVIKPVLPASLESEQDIERFLSRIWKIAFSLARMASV